VDGQESGANPEASKGVIIMECLSNNQTDFLEQLTNKEVKNTTEILKSLTTQEMEVAIMEYVGIRRNLVVPNVSWGMLDYEADIVIVTKHGYATEVEIKISKSDLRADFKKRIQHDSNLFKYLYYAVPEDMKDFALEIIPQRAGLFTVRRNRITHYDSREIVVREIRKPQENKDCVQWGDKERLKLAELGCMRLLGLKRKLLGEKKQS